jgi:predicted transcriptional regulator
MSVEKLMQRSVSTVDRFTSLVDAARQLMQHSVGALIITDPVTSKPVGIITDRDLVAMIAKGLDPKQTSVDWFSQPPLETVRIDDSIEVVTEKMRESGVRRLPVLDAEGRLAGIVSLDDVLVLLGREISDVASAIETGLVQEHAVGSRASWRRI